MTDLLEDTAFDIIVIGTGLTESIVAGSLARSGKKVLHLDSNKQYGSNWSVFNFKNILDWQRQLEKRSISQTENHERNYIDYFDSYANNFQDIELCLGDYLFNTPVILDISSIQDPTEDYILSAIKDTIFSHLPLDVVSETDRERYVLPTIDKLALAILSSHRKEKTYNMTDTVAQLHAFIHGLKLSRHYNLDTTPKILPSRSDLVETLIRSGVGRYMEFKSVDDVFMYDYDHGRLEKVPGSKEDVFVNKTISLTDKRKLMKFLKFTVDEERDTTLLKDYENMSYSQFLDERFKITGNLRNAVVHAISLSKAGVNAKQGLERTKSFMKSVGRFGRGAYLSTLYGGGSEIAQAFCRICAVYGGVYMLGQSLLKYNIDQDTGRCTGIVTESGQVFSSSYIITGFDYLSPDWDLSAINNTSSSVSRAILVTNKPPAKFVHAGSNESLGVGVIPPTDTSSNNRDLVYILNQSSETMACPKGEFVTYLWTLSEDANSKTTLKNAARLLLEEATTDDDPQECARVLFELYYRQRIRSAESMSENQSIPSNVLLCSDPDAYIDFEKATDEARTIFYKCVPKDIEFMPPAEGMDGDDY